MSHSEKLDCPNCNQGTYVTKMEGTSIVFLSGKPGDAIVTEVYKTVDDCDVNHDAPVSTVVMTDCKSGDVRAINSYI